MRGTSLALSILLAACGDDATPLEPTYENVEALIDLSCGSTSSSCHGGTRGSARLNFQLFADTGQPYTEALIGVEACEYDFMPRVDPGNPDNSWLMIKISGPHDADGLLTFTPDPGWDSGLTRRMDGSFPPSQCPLIEEGELTFGYAMPQSRGDPLPLHPRQIELFREWILAGAPGPLM